MLGASLGLLLVVTAVWLLVRAPSHRDSGLAAISSSTVTARPVLAETGTTSLEQLDPAALALRTKSFALYGQGEFATAAAAFEQYLASHAQDVAAAAAYAQSLWQLGQAGAAAQELDALLARSPGDPATLYQLALVERGAARYAQAVTLLRSALVAKGADPEWRIELARTLRMQGEFQSSIEEWRTVLSAMPPRDAARAGVAFEYGMTCAQAGETAEARVAFEEALALRPDDPTIKQQLEQLTASAAAKANGGT